MSFALSLILRPLILLGFFWLVAIIGWCIRRALPAGRVRDFLTQPANMIPRTEAERRSWVPVLAWLTASVIIWGALLAWVTAADGHW